MSERGAELLPIEAYDASDGRRPGPPDDMVGVGDVLIPSGYGPSGGGKNADIDVGDNGPEPLDMLPVRCACDVSTQTYSLAGESADAPRPAGSC